MTPRWESNAHTAHAKLLRPFSYLSAQFGRIDVPTGFETDFASVPYFARWYVDVVDPDILYPAIIHDWLYQERGELPTILQPLSRAEADGVLREAMRAIGAPAVKVALVHRAVRLGGGKAWDS